MSESQSSKPTRGRIRRGQPVILQFRSDIPPNEHHPLAHVEPDTRAMQRQTVIASILARLAEGHSDMKQKDVTILSQKQATLEEVGGTGQE